MFMHIIATNGRHSCVTDRPGYPGHGRSSYPDLRFGVDSHAEYSVGYHWTACAEFWHRKLDGAGVPSYPACRAGQFEPHARGPGTLGGNGPSSSVSFSDPISHRCHIECHHWPNGGPLQRLSAAAEDSKAIRRNPSPIWGRTGEVSCVRAGFPSQAVEAPNLIVNWTPINRTPIYGSRLAALPKQKSPI